MQVVNIDKLEELNAFLKTMKKEPTKGETLQAIQQAQQAQNQIVVGFGLALCFLIVVGIILNNKKG